MMSKGKDMGSEERTFRRGWDKAMARAEQIAEDVITDIDTNFRLNIPQPQDHLADVCQQAQRNGARAVLLRLRQRAEYPKEATP